MSELVWTEHVMPAWREGEQRHTAEASGKGWTVEFAVELDSTGWNLQADYWLPCELIGFWSNRNDVADVETGKALAACWAAELAGIAAALRAHETEMATETTA